MATVSTPAKLSSVKTVFGGGGSLLAYLRGGSNVMNFPNAYSTIATSAPLTLSSFAGKINPTTAFTNATIILTDTAISPSGAQSSYTVRSNGQLSLVGAGGSNQTWLLTGSAADYQIIYTKTSGTNPGGSSTNTWLSLASTISWSITENRDGFYTTSCSGTLQIRMASSPQTVLHSFTMSLEAVVEI